jgi:hypothetical protein
MFPVKEEEKNCDTCSSAEGQEDANFCWLFRRN